MAENIMRLKAQEFAKDIVGIRRRLHSRPELDFDLPETASAIEEVLSSLGMKAYRCAGSGVVSVLRGRGDGRTVAVRADMDALPIEEPVSCPCRSEIEGRMHACGHDAHVAVALGTAMVLSSVKDDLPGNVKFIFQPAEETSGGALPMIEEGVLENPRVDAAFALHVMPELETGKIGIRPGKMRAASDMFDIVVGGRSSHGAEPDKGIDAVVIAARIVDILQTLVSRRTAPLDNVVVTIGRIEGGLARNVIAPSVKMSGIIRTVSPSARKYLTGCVVDVVDSVCRSMGGEGKVAFTEGYPCLVNDSRMTELVEKSAVRVLGPDGIFELEHPSMGVDDFAYFLERVPGCYFMLGVGDPAQSEHYPLHSPEFSLDERSLAPASALLAEICLTALEMRLFP